MNDETPGLAGAWPLLVTCVGVILMGVIILTATSDPSLGWVFVGFGVVVIVATVVRAAVGAVRDRRD